MMHDENMGTAMVTPEGEEGVVAHEDDNAGRKHGHCDGDARGRRGHRGAPRTTMQDENMGTAMVTPASASAYCSARLPKKMQQPEAMAKPIEDLFSCIEAQHRCILHSTASIGG